MSEFKSIDTRQSIALATFKDQAHRLPASGRITDAEIDQTFAGPEGVSARATLRRLIHNGWDGRSDLAC